MRFKTISATEARKKWFELLNLVYFKGEEVVIEKNNKPMVKLSAVGTPEVDKMPIEEFIKKTYGYLKENKGKFPYQEDKKVIAREKKYMKRIKKWKPRI